MVSVQKINFRANSSALLPQNPVSSATTNAPISTQTSSLVNAPSKYSSSAQADVSSTNTTSNPVVTSVTKQNEKSQLKTAKTVSYVSAGVALASLGVGIIAHKNAKVSSEALKGLESKLEVFTGNIEKNLESKLAKVEEKITEKSNWYDGVFSGLQNKINSVKYEIEDKINSTSAAFVDAPSGEYFSHVVNINGKDLRLASVVNDISNPKVRGSFERELRSDSTKRLFGLRKPLAKMPEDPYIRIVSVELKPFSPVGGMSIVPKEITEELPKILNKHNNPTFVLDTEMYTGRVGMENGQEITWKLVEDKANNLFYYQKHTGGVIKDREKDIFPVDLIDEIEVPIVGQAAEKVRLFRTKAIDGSKVAFDSLKKLFDKDYLQFIEDKISAISKETKGTLFETNNYKIVRDEHGKELFVPKLKYNLWDNRKFNLDIPIDGDPDIYSERNISSGLTEREIFFNKYIYEHTVNMKNRYQDGALKDKAGNVLLKADAFILNDWQTGPLAAMLRLGTIAKKYFGKLDSETAKEIQDIPVMSLLHNAKYHGSVGFNQDKFLNVMFDETAAQVAPNAYAPNLSSMDEGIAQNLLNPLFNGHDLSPMNMLVNYSDSLNPVSEKYKYEIATNDFYGSGLTNLYNLRSKFKAKENPEEYVKQVRTMAIKNDVEMDGITDEMILKPTIRGKDNGLNKIDNILTEDEIAKTITDPQLGAEFKHYGFDKLMPYRDNLTAAEALEMKNHNKSIALNYFKDAVNEAKGYEKNGKMNTWLGDMTNLEGVSEKTPIFETAGRIDPQKGYELYINSMRHYINTLHKEGDEIPVFIIQGQVLDGYGKNIVKIVENFKKELIESGKKQFADRIVFLDRGNGFKYTISKLVTDHPIMSSIFEPKGLTHHEFSYKSGGIAVGNDTGGILEGLTDDVDVFAVKYNPNPPNGERPEYFADNVENFANGISRACNVHKNDEKYGEMIRRNWDQDISWTADGGTAFAYVDDLAEFNLVPKIKKQ